MTAILDSDIVALEWIGPFTMRQVLIDLKDEKPVRGPGVYLWLDHAADPVHLCYVGRATGRPDLWTRQWQHYTAMIAGHYVVPQHARSSKVAWGMVYSKETAERLFDVEQYIELVRECHAYAEHLRVYLCPLPETQVRMVERQLIYDLQCGSTARGASNPPSTPVKTVHRNATWYQPHMLGKGVRETVIFA